MKKRPETINIIRCAHIFLYFSCQLNQVQYNSNKNRNIFTVVVADKKKTRRNQLKNNFQFVVRSIRIANIVDRV